ncbi:MAG: hypothetical protein LPK08_08485 [Halomonas sp.]|uniref:Glyoxalase-like domain-containing protein n=2 Tax=Halomonadaceae TaxID=28256 RepID=A0ABS6ZK70_9GAMM|nr:MULTISPECIES: hypothetical protein [Halomonas]MBW6390464.1 hypothetical protein [Halomonas antri]MDX5377534.1 hypothetical protein [Halomonas sp.]MDX5502917.1 hypothetical protein [Halomonas sp.]QTP57669.1 hypothetical protein HNO53_02360 [Halomonas sulfidivorans]
MPHQHDSHLRYPDIEIYLRQPQPGAIDAWLGETLDAAPLRGAGRGKWQTRGHHEGHEVPVLLVEKAADGFASLWFDSSHTPWLRDCDCARDAAARLGCEVRCSLGGWQPGDDPDRFWQVLPDGSENAIDWPDSGQ